jgi:hypothetical protein
MMNQVELLNMGELCNPQCIPNLERILVRLLNRVTEDSEVTCSGHL